MYYVHFVVSNPINRLGWHRGEVIHEHPFAWEEKKKDEWDRITILGWQRLDAQDVEAYQKARAAR